MRRASRLRNLRIHRDCDCRRPTCWRPAPLANERFSCPTTLLYSTLPCSRTSPRSPATHRRLPTRPTPSRASAYRQRCCARSPASAFAPRPPSRRRPSPPCWPAGDITGVAQTGTGKTAAFGLPLLAAIDPRTPGCRRWSCARPASWRSRWPTRSPRSRPRCPTSRWSPVYGGTGFLPQRAALRAGAQVVVGTPGRIIDHLERGTLDLSGAAVPGAGRGRRDAADGIRRGRRPDPVRRARRPADRAVLRHHAARRSAPSPPST